MRRAVSNPISNLHTQKQQNKSGNHWGASGVLIDPPCRPKLKTLILIFRNNFCRFINILFHFFLFQLRRPFMCKWGFAFHTTETHGRLT